MTTIPEFVAAIRENPDDDDVRLALADYLAGHGEPDWARLIRVQCQLASMPADDRDRGWLEQFEEQLLDQHELDLGIRLLGPPQRRRSDYHPVGRGVTLWELHRGLIEEVVVTALAFIQRSEAWTQTTLIRQAHLVRVAGRVERLAACKQFSDLVSLRINDRQFSDADLARLLQSPYLARLTSLIIQSGRVTGDLKTISAFLEGKRDCALDLSWCSIPYSLGRRLTRRFGDRVVVLDR
jgi:uncharacterized protein (TIGR02996 family)